MSYMYIVIETACKENIKDKSTILAALMNND